MWGEWLSLDELKPESSQKHSGERSWLPGTHRQLWLIVFVYSPSRRGAMAPKLPWLIVFVFYSLPQLTMDSLNQAPLRKAYIIFRRLFDSISF